MVFFGLFQLFSYKLKIDSNYIPFVTTLSITLVLFISGLLNVMPETVYLIIVVSFASLLWIYYKERRFANLNSAGMWFFFIGSSLLASFLWGNTVFLYDDFSHWTLVTREILINDRLPNFTDDIISFQSYPTGEAGFAYFFGKILGDSEGVMLASKAILSLSCLSPLFSLINKNKITNYIILSLYSVLVLFSNNGLNSMYVDSLLTLISIGITANILATYLEDDINKSILPLLLGNSVLVIMKNSGLLFAIINIMIFLFCKFKKRDFKKPLETLIGLASPFIVRTLWDKHTSYVFKNASESKHSMSIESYQNISNVKSSEEISVIIEKVIDRSTDFCATDSRIVIVLFSFLIILILIKLFVLRDSSYKPDLKILVSLVSLYIIYQVGLLFTYVYSMPTEEALRIASYGRYNSTMVLYILGIFMCYRFINSSRSIISVNWINSGVIMMILLMFIYNIKTEIESVIKSTGYTSSARATYHELKNSYIFNPEERIIVYASDRYDLIDSGYLYYMTVYDFRNTQLDIISQRNPHRLSEIVGTSNATLIILKHDEEILKQLKKLGIDSPEKVINFRMGE